MNTNTITKITTAAQLIQYLDTNPEFDKYAVFDAAYDDDHYNRIPLDMLLSIGFTREKLESLNSIGDGAVYIENGVVRIIGPDNGFDTNPFK